MVMRALLRRLCIDNGFAGQISDTPSLNGLINRLLNENVIDEGLTATLHRIRISTHAAEWGSGDAPTDSDIRYVLNKAPAVLKDVQSIIQK
jgi:hypothetical protein